MTIKRILESLPETLTVEVVLTRRVFASGSVGYYGAIPETVAGPHLVKGGVNLTVAAPKGKASIKDLFEAGVITDPDELVPVKAGKAKDASWLEEAE